MKKVFISFIFVILMLTTSAMKADAIDNATFVLNNNSTLPNKNILSNAQQNYNLIADSNVSSYTDLKNELQNPNTTTINIEGDLSGTEPLGTQQAESLTINGAKHRLTGVDTAGFTLDTSKSLTLSNFIQINGFTNTNGGVIYVTPDSTNTNITINNVIFTNNSATTHGGAIYAENLTLIANNGTTSFSNNYITNGSTKTFEAIYISKTNGNLDIISKNSGIVSINDIINGEKGYTININSDSTSNVTLNNAVKNANLILNSGNLILSENSDGDGNSIKADFSSSIFNANNGVISMEDNKATTYNMGVLHSSASTLYNIDILYKNNSLTSDILTTAAGSTGTITLNSLGTFTLDTIGIPTLLTNTYTIKILNKSQDSDSIKLSLNTNITNEFNKDRPISDFYNATQNAYILTPDSITGMVGIKVDDAGDRLILGLLKRYDTLATINQFTPSGSNKVADRYFKLSNSSDIYYVTDNTGTTSRSRTMYVQGVKGSAIDYQNKFSGFVLPTTAKLTINDIEIRNAKSTNKGAAINNSGTLNTNGVIFNSNSISNTTDAFGGAIYNTGSAAFTNTSFINNYTIGTTSAHGGAIYSTNNFSINVNNNSIEISGNYVQSDLSKVYEAIYMANTGTQLTLSSRNNGKLIINDIISGTTDSYNLIMNGDNTSSIVVGNSIENANITLSTTTLQLNKSNPASGADFSNSKLNAQNGTISLKDNVYENYNLGILTSSNSVSYIIDMELNNSKLTADKITVKSGSNGTITINELNGLNITQDNLKNLITNSASVKILYKENASDSIRLALSKSITDKYNQTISLPTYFNTTSDSYKVNYDDFIGDIGITLTNNADTITFGVISVRDTLAATNQYTPSASDEQKDRYFILPENITYSVTENTGTTGKVGIMYVQGGNNSIIDYQNTYSGFDIQAGAILDISNIQFRNAISNSKGGIINNSGIVGATTISGINNSSFINNTAIMGGAIYNIGTIYSIANTNFTENIVTSSRESTYGGAIYNTGTIGRIENVTFTQNKAVSSQYAYGGAIYNTGNIEYISASFIGNYTVGTNVFGGAIYSSNNLKLIANNQDFMFKDNYTQSTSTGSIEDNAIYMSSYQSILTIEANNGGSWTLYDSINGARGYTVTLLSTEGRGTINLYNQIYNANVVTNNINLNLSGDNSFTTYTFNSLSSTLTNLSIDLSYSEKKSDIIKVISDSTGKITINELVGLDKSEIKDEIVKITVLDKNNSSSIILELSQELQDKYKGDIELNKYLPTKLNLQIILVLLVLN